MAGACPCRRHTAGFRSPRTFNVLCDPFSETTPTGSPGRSLERVRSCRRRRAEPSAGARTLLQKGGVRGRHGLLPRRGGSRDRGERVRPRPHRPADGAARRRVEGITRGRAKESVDPGDRAHCLRDRRDGQGGDPVWGVRLPHQAVRQREPPHVGAGRPRAEGRRRRPPEGAARIGPGDFRVRGDRRTKRGDAGGLRTDRPGRPHRRQRDDPGRERHGEGAGGRRPPRPQPPESLPLRPDQLRRHTGDADRERTVRARSRRVHRSRADEKRALRDGAPGNPLP